MSVVLVLGGFFLTLVAGGWSPGDPVGEGAPLHHLRVQATTMSFLGIIACQPGTAVPPRWNTWLGFPPSR